MCWEVSCSISIYNSFLFSYHIISFRPGDDEKPVFSLGGFVGFTQKWWRQLFDLYGFSLLMLG